jgi:hypothetical protein
MPLIELLKSLKESLAMTAGMYGQIIIFALHYVETASISIKKLAIGLIIVKPHPQMPLRTDQKRRLYTV